MIVRILMFLGLGGLLLGMGFPGKVGTTVFPDGKYTRFDWRSFAEWGPANQPIDLYRPDYGLLNAAIFYATNEQRELRKRDPFIFSPALRDAIALHCDQMVDRKFYGHKNPKNRKLRTPHQRIKTFTKEFVTTGENIAATNLLQIGKGEKYLSVKKGDQYIYYSRSKKILTVHTYQSFAKYLVRQWMRSSGHRKNIMNRDFTHMGCAARVVEYNLNKRKLPMAKSGQNFGGKGD